MSSRSRDIIRELSGHLTSVDREGLEHVIMVMHRYIPRVHIDPVYKNNLRKTLLTTDMPLEKQFGFVFPHISFAWIRISGTLMASFFIGIFLWKVYSVTPQIPPIQEKSRESLIQMNTPDLSPSGAHMSPVAPAPSDPEVIKPQAKIQEVSPVKINNPEILENIDTTLIELDTVMTPEVSNISDVAYSDIGASAETMPMMMRAMAPVIRIPSYPVNMTLYMKSGESFTRDEIQSLSGTDLIAFSARTEQNLTLLQSRIEKKLGSNMIDGEGEIIYREMKKRGQTDTNTHYLIPGILYSLLDGGEIFVPIVLGYE